MHSTNIKHVQAFVLKFVLLKKNEGDEQEKLFLDESHKNNLW
jgi:hypothetical protein